MFWIAFVYSLDDVGGNGVYWEGLVNKLNTQVRLKSKNEMNSSSIIGVELQGKTWNWILELECI